MKKLFLCAFIVAVTCAVQAGDNAKAATTACAEQTKGCCEEKTSCCATAKVAKAKVAKKADTSVKGATLLVRR